MNPNAQRTARIVREAYNESLKKKAEAGKNSSETPSRGTLRDTPSAEAEKPEGKIP